jgi:hypothetical protein
MSTNTAESCLIPAMTTSDYGGMNILSFTVVMSTTCSVFISSSVSYVTLTTLTVISFSTPTLVDPTPCMTLVPNYYNWNPAF